MAIDQISHPNTDSLRQTSRWRPRLSLLSMLLLTTVVALVVTLILRRDQHAREVRRLAGRIETLERDLGCIDNKDESKPALNTLGTRNPAVRRWRVYLPQDKTWRLGVFSGLVPSNGYNLETATNRKNGRAIQWVPLPSTPPTGAEVELGLFRNPTTGKAWMLHVSVPGKVSTIRLAPEVQDYLSSPDFWPTVETEQALGARTLRQLETSGASDLWRTMYSIGKNPPSGHKPGFVVWVESQPIVAPAD